MFSHRNSNGAGHSPRKLDANTSTRDEELIHAARRGDKRAFVEIVARHQAMVCGIALGILGDFAASEDAAQDAFLTAWRKLHELREPDRLRAWLAQIARNSALGHLRRTRGHETLDDDALALADESPTPDQLAANDEEAALVRAFLSRLPETYRLPLVLYYREGQSVRAVADALAISEDAVKQRLSRGREMLRDQMSGLLENVLTRTAPSVIFTMTIAVAIGALAAPAAIAGTVFTAAAAGTATTSASTASSTSLLTLMSTSKSFLIAAALVAVACIPVGYQLSTGRASLAQTNVVAGVQAPQTNVQTVPPTFENSALFAEWRELHQKHGTNAAAMPVLHKAIADLKDPFRRRAFHAALVAEWAQVDASGGLQFFLAKGRDGGQRRQFLEEWLARDARAAVDALLRTEGPGWQAMARACLPEIAWRAPSRIADVATRLPAAESYWDTNVRDAFAIAAEGDLNSARSAAEAMTSVNRDQALAGIAKVWAKNDLNATISWAKALPDGTDRDEIIRVALLGKAIVDPATALDLVGIVPAGGRNAYFAVTTGARVLAEAAKTDFDATVAWLTAHPGRLGRNELEGLSQAVTDRLNADAAGFLSAHLSPGSALLPAIQSALLNSASGQRPLIWDWLKTRPENETTKTLKNYILTSAAWQDPDLALRWVDELPPTVDGDKQVRELARNLFNGSQGLHRYENLLRDAPDRLRQPLVQAAFDCLNGDTFANPQQWISRLSLLPEDSRPKAVSQIAAAWAMQTPEGAIDWVESLPSGEARNGAAASIVSGWASKDAQGAADWVTEMPPGAERDRSAQSLAMVLADKYPRQAWDWALSIGDPNTRSDAATHAVRTMAARDPATARQWIETGPFTPEIRAALQVGLANPGPRSK